MFSLLQGPNSGSEKSVRSIIYFYFMAAVRSLNSFNLQNRHISELFR